MSNQNQNESADRDSDMEVRKSPSEVGAMKLILTIDDEGMLRIEAIVAELKERGFSVENVMELSGIVTGSFDGNFKELESVTGVAAAEESKRKYTL